MVSYVAVVGLCKSSTVKMNFDIYLDIVMHSDFNETNSNFRLVRYLLNKPCYMHNSFRYIFCNKVSKFFQCHYVAINSVKLNKVLCKEILSMQMTNDTVHYIVY